MPDKTDHSEPHMEPDVLRHTTPPRLKFYGVVALCAAAAIVVVGLGLRFYASNRTENWTEEQAVPSELATEPLLAGEMRPRPETLMLLTLTSRGRLRR